MARKFRFPNESMLRLPVPHAHRSELHPRLIFMPPLVGFYAAPPARSLVNCFLVNCFLVNYFLVNFLLVNYFLVTYFLVNYFLVNYFLVN